MLYKKSVCTCFLQEHTIQFWGPKPAKKHALRRPGIYEKEHDKVGIKDA